MNRVLGVVGLVALIAVIAAGSYMAGVATGQSKGYIKGQTEAKAQVDAQVQTGYERGYQAGYNEAVKHPPIPEPQRNIEIRGLRGLSTNNIYLVSNATDLNNYYSVWRLAYDPAEYFFNPSDFDTLDKIKARCRLVVRTIPSANSLIYTDWATSVDYLYIYCVTQDDGDFSSPLQFR